jgi:hypothetical protein
MLGSEIQQALRLMSSRSAGKWSSLMPLMMRVHVFEVGGLVDVRLLVVNW